MPGALHQEATDGSGERTDKTLSAATVSPAIQLLPISAVTPPTRILVTTRTARRPRSRVPNPPWPLQWPKDRSETRLFRKFKCFRR